MANKTEWPKLPKLPKDVLSRLAKCLALVPDRKLKAVDAPCVMGGKAPLPVGMDWPSRDGELLTYVGRINTTVAHSLLDEVPDVGWLLFFHEPEDDRLQTIVVAKSLGELKGPPKGSKYLTVDMRCGPDDGKVSESVACHLVPAWSYAYDPSADWDEEVKDAMDELMPEKAIGQLLGHAYFEEESSCRRAFGVAKYHASGRSDVSLTEEKLLEKRKQVQEIPPPTAHTFACPKLGNRLKSLVDELMVLEADWKQRAKKEGKSWSGKLSTACKVLAEYQAETIKKMAQGAALELGPMIEAFKTWDTAFYVMENAQDEKRLNYLFEWSKELRAKQAQVGNLADENEEERLKKEERDEARKMKEKNGGYFNQEYEDWLEHTRSRLSVPISNRLFEASQRGKNVLETVEWSMKELERIGDRLGGSEVSLVLVNVMNLLNYHTSQTQSAKGGMSAKEIDAALAGMREKRTVIKGEPVNVSKKWRLLLSFNSELDYCWSDSGSLRYFIEEAKLAKEEFDRVVSDIESG
ncbi:MAG TPA: DUF1963 domain-containing protein [Verrucomicrobiae bacterium]